MNSIQLQTLNNVPVVESLLVADGLGIQHKNLLETIGKYQTQIESSFGHLAFETRPGYNNAPVRVAFLNDGQFMFIGALSRNTKKVVDFKAQLVSEFQKAKGVIQQLAVPMSDAELMAQALTVAHRITAQTEQRVLLLEAQTGQQEEIIKELAPKGKYYDQVLKADGPYSATNAAQHFEMSAIKFNKILKDLKIQRFVNGMWVLCSRYQGHGYTKNVPYTFKGSGDTQRSKDQMMWTPKGLEFLHGVFSKHLTAA